MHTSNPTTYLQARALARDWQALADQFTDALAYDSGVVHEAFAGAGVDLTGVGLAAEWADVADAMIAALLRDPVAGHDLCVDVDLEPTDLPDSETWVIVNAIADAAELGIELTPKLLHEVARDRGVFIPIEDLERLWWAESTSAGAVNYLRLLRTFGRRRRLYHRLRAACDEALDRFDPPSDFARRVAAELTAFADEADDLCPPKPKPVNGAGVRFVKSKRGAA